MQQGQQGANAQGQAAAAAAQQPVQQAVAFALAPNQADDQVIDYSTKSGIKRFERAIESLSSKFNGKSNEMTVFKGDLLLRATNCGWDNGMADADIINIADANGTARNLITEYSRLTKERIVQWATANIVNRQTRAAQNNANMYQCLYNTLEKSCQEDMLLRQHEFTVNGVKIAALLYKSIMSTASIDTSATVALTRTRLVSLDDLMINECNSNIQKFNVKVAELRQVLTRYGQQSEDLLINLFRGYNAAQDKYFQKYISDLEQDHLFGEADIDAETLMAKALTAYQVRSEAGKWGVLSEEQQMIVAMKAELKTLKDSRLQLDPNKKKKGNRKKKQKQKNGDKEKQKEKDDDEGDKKWAWKNVPPKGNQSNSKKFEGKTYYWCIHHNKGNGMWTLHKPEDCKSKPKGTEGDDSTSNDQVQASAAMAALESSDDE